MHCRFNFSLPSAGFVSLITTLTNFAVPHMPDKFTFFPSSFCLTFPIHWLHRLSSEGCFAFFHNFFLPLVVSALPPHPCILYECGPFTPLAFACTGLLTDFPALLPGNCRHKIWLNPANLFADCCKWADTGHLSGSQTACENVYFGFALAFKQCHLCWRKKMHVWHYKK